MTPNSRSSCCTSAASRWLRVEYEIWIAFPPRTGRIDEDPSPSNSARRNVDLKEVDAPQTKEGTHLCALRRPIISASGLDRKSTRFWISSSLSTLVDALVREYE